MCDKCFLRESRNAKMQKMNKWEEKIAIIIAKFAIMREMQKMRKTINAIIHARKARNSRNAIIIAHA